MWPTIRPKDSIPLSSCPRVIIALHIDDGWIPVTAPFRFLGRRSGVTCASMFTRQSAKPNWWSISNKLSISIAKTKYMLFGRKPTLCKNPPSVQLFLGSTPLELVHRFCYLGVTFDDILSFSPMIDIMHHKAAYKFRTLLFVRQHMTTSCALTFVCSMILPYIDYGCLLISSCSWLAINRLQLLQNKMLQCVRKVHKGYNIRELHFKCGILMIEDRIKYNQLKFIYVNVLSRSPLFTPRASIAH